jgi:hypothetical protein
MGRATITAGRVNLRWTPLSRPRIGGNKREGTGGLRAAAGPAPRRKPRTICLYTTVSGNGNNAMFTIVGFAGVRIVDYNFQGSNKYILIHPANVADSTVVSGNNSKSYNVYQPVTLVR